MVPGDRVHFQHLWHTDETTEVHALAKRHRQPLVDHITVANALRCVGHVLQKAENESDRLYYCHDEVVADNRCVNDE